MERPTHPEFTPGVGGHHYPTEPKLGTHSTIEKCDHQKLLSARTPRLSLPTFIELAFIAIIANPTLP